MMANKGDPVGMTDFISVPHTRGLNCKATQWLWVYGQEAWLPTLAVEPGWLGAVYEG